MRSSVIHWFGLVLLVQFGIDGTALGGYDPEQMQLPPGFKVTTYITGSGFYEDQRGIPAIVSLAFPPANPATRKLGIAGDLFMMVFPELDFPVREIIRISGPFDSYVRGETRKR